MNHHTDTAIGQNVATVRRLRGLTQARLAERANVSVSLVSKVEAGYATATPTFVAAAARALNVSSAELQGQPYRGHTPSTDRVHEAIAPLRRELAAYASAPSSDAQSIPLSELRPRVDLASKLRHSVDLTRSGQMVPGLLADLRRATYGLTPGTHGWENAYSMLAETYAAASQYAYKLGYGDLASIAVDRYEWAAQRSGDALAVCVGDYQRAGELIMVAEYEAAQRVLDDARHHIEDDLGRGEPPTLAVWGNLHLKSALIAARDGQSVATWDYYAVAREAVERIGTDRDDYRLMFGPTNVAIWGVGLAVELGDGTEAVKRAHTVRPPAGYARERISHHYIDLARGHLWHGDREAALRDLMKARDVAPDHTRYHPMVRETVRALGRLDRRRTDTLTGFATWLDKGAREGAVKP